MGHLEDQGSVGRSADPAGKPSPPPPPPPGPRNAQAAAAGSASPGAYFHHLQLVLQGKGLPPHVKKYRKLQLVCTRESCNQFTMHSIFLSL